MREPRHFLGILCIFGIGCFDWLWIGKSVSTKAPRRSCIQRGAQERIVSHTQMMIFPPWDEEFEANWEVPEGALSGYLLRSGSGTYLAVLEWDSELAYKRWMSLGKRPDLLNEKTKIFHRVNPKSETEKPEKPKSAESAAEIFKRLGLSKTRSETQAEQAEKRVFDDRPPEVDPAVLFAISAGEDVNIDLEDEILISGGDPSFLDDQKWQSNPVGEEDEADLEDDITFSGGDPSFLDDQMWGSNIGDEQSDFDLEDDITASGGDPSFLEDEWISGTGKK